jgi:hypothetical protein
MVARLNASGQKLARDRRADDRERIDAQQLARQYCLIALALFGLPIGLSMISRQCSICCWQVSTLALWRVMPNGLFNSVLLQYCYLSLPRT